MKLKLYTSDILNCPLMKKISKTDIKPASAEELNSSLAKISATTPPQKGAEISAAYSKASINIQNKTDELINSVQNLLKENYLLESGEHIHRPSLSSKENTLRFRIGDEIKGFKGLYNENKNACMYFTNDGHPDRLFIQNKMTGEIDILNCADSVITRYSKSDVEALKYYKYHPDAIHDKLRYGRNMYSGSFKTEMENVIENLTKLFSDKTKVFKNSENRTLYRALQNLSDADIKKLSTVGEVFTEKSFCSTTRDLKVAKRFQSGNPILEIEFPKDSEYIDIERMFNIDIVHWREAEFLLDKNSKFMVTGFDTENNIIKVKYLGKE